MSFLLLAACGEKETNSKPTNPSASETEFSGFLSFYEQFHQDSLFQIEHILFPLAGMPSMLDDEAVSADFKWQREDWKMQRPLDPDGEFTQKFNPVDSALIIEYILHRTGKYGMERRFAKLGEDWKLIYYTDLNSIRVSTQ